MPHLKNRKLTATNPEFGGSVYPGNIAPTLTIGINDVNCGMMRSA